MMVEFPGQDEQQKHYKLDLLKLDSLTLILWVLITQAQIYRWQIISLSYFKICILAEKHLEKFG